ncbi:hypothetical protein IF2G_11000 [Cordyceps javanica]|nr:hypothetical protein IF2G_11000 [Cordyceps javanica]
MLWLPPDYRERCAASHSSFVAIGTASGKGCSGVLHPVDEATVGTKSDQDKPRSILGPEDLHATCSAFTMSVRSHVLQYAKLCSLSSIYGHSLPVPWRAITFTSRIGFVTLNSRERSEAKLPVFYFESTSAMLPSTKFQPIDINTRRRHSTTAEVELPTSENERSTTAAKSSRYRLSNAVIRMITPERDGFLIAENDSHWSIASSTCLGLAERMTIRPQYGSDRFVSYTETSIMYARSSLAYTHEPRIRSYPEFSRWQDLRRAANRNHY